MRKTAFTLAEVLITLSVIGVVAALTIPGLITKWQDEAFLTQKKVVDAKLTEATRQMNLHDDLVPYTNTDGFVTKFKKYMKYAEKCDSSSLTKCFADTINKTTGEEVKVDTLRNSTNLGKEYSTPNMSFSLIDGTTFLMTYDPECIAPDPYSSKISTTACLGYIVDVNGQKKPNTVGKDIILVNVSLPGAGCDGIEIANLCVSSGNVTYYIPAIGSPGVADAPELYAYGLKAAKEACQAIGMRVPNYYESAVLGKNASLLQPLPDTIASMLGEDNDASYDIDEVKNSWDSVVAGGMEDMYNGSIYGGMFATNDGRSVTTRCIK